MLKEKKTDEEMPAKKKETKELTDKTDEVSNSKSNKVKVNKSKSKATEAPISTDGGDNNSKKSKLEQLKAKAKALEEKVEGEEKVEIKKDETEVKTKLAPIEDYLKSSIHLGTKVITPDMKQFVYKRRNDGLAVFNTELLDKKLEECAEFLSKYAPEDIILVCKREAGWKAVELFSKITGIKIFTKKYPAGILTNPALENFFETKLVFICDPWLDKNALADARNIGLPVLAICDTNNYTAGITQILPGNNKSAKSLGFILYIISKLYCEKRKIKVGELKIEDFVEDWENLVPPK